MKGKGWMALIAALVALTLTASLAAATAYNTITPDGSMSDWATDEFMEQDAGSDLYVTWDENSLYVALNNVDWGTEGDLFIYLDVVAGGSTTSENWNGTHTLPFEADYVFCVENGYYNLRRYTAGAWQPDQPYSGSNYLGGTGNENTEIELPWGEIGSPTSYVYLLVFAQNENDQGVWASWPTPNPASGAGSEIFTHHYHFPSLVDGLSPDDSVLADHVIVNEFAPKGTEWIELYNPTAASVSLIGWSLTDGEGTDTLTGTIPAGGYVVTPTNNIILSNDGDEIMLYDDGAALVDQVTYGRSGAAPIAPTNDTTARTPNGTDTDDDAQDWTLDPTPTSGVANDAPAVLLGSSLLINEMNNYSPPTDDAIEFYNPLTASVPITNWLLSDGDGWGTILTTTAVPAGGWLALNPNDYGVSFTSSDVAYLFRPDGVRVDQIGWYGEFEDGTFQRICDGDGPNDGYDWDSSGGNVTWFDLPETLGGTNTPGPVDMEIVKTGPLSVSPGGLITYVVTYQGLNPLPTTAFLITDYLPAEVELVDYDADPPLVEMGTDPLWWDAGAQCGFPAGVITITVQVTDTAQAGDEVVNQVEIDASGDLTPTNDTDVVTTTVAGLDVTVLKSGPADPLRAGDTISYTVSYVLAGDEDALGMSITDTFPTGFAYVDHLAPPAFSCTASASDLVCSAATVTQSGAIILTGTVPAMPVEYVITNTVEITASNDGTPANNDDEYANHIVMPIQEIQYVPDPANDDASPYAGQFAWIEGVVIAASDVYPTVNNRYFLEDPAGGPWSGIYIYNGDDKPPVAEGDWVLLYGQVEEYYNVTELSIRDSVGGIQQVISTSNPLPAPEIIATGAFTPDGAATAEAYESVLIEFQDAVVTDDDLGNGEWAFTDGSGEAHADDWSQYLTYEPTLGDIYAYIRGIGNYSFDEYKLVPRYDADIDLDYSVTFFYNDAEDVVYNGEDVYVAGDFNGWDPNATALAANASYSVFSTTIILADPITTEYKYIVKSGGDQWDWLNTGNRSASVIGPTVLDDYRNVSVGYAHLMEPPTITLTLGETTPDISGEVYIQNVTDPAGLGRAVWAELGYGMSNDVDLWDWMTMDYTGNQNGNNDIYTGTVTPVATGVYSYAVRFDGNRGPGNPNAGWTYGDLEGVWPGNPFDLSQTGVLTVTQPNLSIQKDVVPTADVELGGVVTYTIVLDNAGDGTAWNVDMTDTLPDEVDFDSWVQQSGATVIDDVVSWTGDLAGNNNVVIIFTALVGTDPSFYGQTVTNTASFTSDNAGSGADDAIFTIIGAPSLTIDKMVEPTMDVELGGVVTYTITLDNAGDSAAWNVDMTDTLPDEVDFDSWVQQSGATVIDDVVSWTGDLAGNNDVVIIFTALVGTDPSFYGQTVTNTAPFTSDNAGSGANDAIFTTIGAPGLTIDKYVAPTMDVDLGSVVTYTIILDNVGDSAAWNVDMTDTLPDEVDFDGWVQQSGATVVDDVVSWSGDIAGNNDVVIIFTALVGTDPTFYGQAVTNTTSFTSDNAGSGANDAVFTTISAPGLTIDKMVEPKEVDLGGVVTFTIVLNNAGDSAALGVIMTDVLPVEVDFGGWVQQNGALQANDTITWTGDIAGGSDVTFVFTALVGTDEAFYGRAVTNTATFASDNAGSGADPTGFTIAGLEGYNVYLPIVLRNR